MLPTVPKSLTLVQIVHFEKIPIFHPFQEK